MADEAIEFRLHMQDPQPILFVPADAKSSDDWLYHRKPLRQCTSNELQRLIGRHRRHTASETALKKMSGARR